MFSFTLRRGEGWVIIFGLGLLLGQGLRFDSSFFMVEGSKRRGDGTYTYVPAVEMETLPFLSRGLSGRKKEALSRLFVSAGWQVELYLFRGTAGHLLWRLVAIVTTSVHNRRWTAHGMTSRSFCGVGGDFWFVGR